MIESGQVLLECRVDRRYIQMSAGDANGVIFQIEFDFECILEILQGDLELFPPFVVASEVVKSDPHQFKPIGNGLI